MIEDRKNTALHEIAKQLAQKHSVQTAPYTVYQFPAKRGIMFKERQTMPVSSKGRMCLSAG